MTPTLYNSIYYYCISRRSCQVVSLVSIDRINAFIIIINLRFMGLFNVDTVIVMFIMIFIDFLHIR